MSRAESQIHIQGARVVLPDRVEERWEVVVDDGKITSVGPDGGASVEDRAVAVEASGCYLAAGFIDLHIHGSGEFLVDEGSESLQGLANLLPSFGVTGFLPTVAPTEKAAHIARVRELAQKRYEGTAVLGFFIEGPFLSVPGALEIDPGLESDVDWVTSIREAASPYSAVFAVSPEFPGVVDMLPDMTSGGVPAFITHTRAGVEDTAAAIRAGATHATHFYDVFYAPDETEPGVRPCGSVEAILASPATSVDFILDGEHVHPEAVKLALGCLGRDRVCLITDANRGAGLPPGRNYRFGNNEVAFAYEGAPARFTDRHPTLPGLLAGSGLTMCRAVRNAVDMLDLDLPTAVTMAASAPARVLGLEERKGKIAPGYDADLVLLDSGTLEPVVTWVGGREVFRQSES